MLNVTFTPTDAMPTYQGSCLFPGNSQKSMIVIEGAGTYSLPDQKAHQVCSDFPKNFKAVGGWKPQAIMRNDVRVLTPAEGGQKAEGEPDKNKGMGEPDKNK